ncbi:hypothetical protein [Nocardia abscessus]|uniref:hypothetical protein n=1 Tax=Nocardia abscessus TaxID=120957 RepID=UPI0005B9BB1E|nr:hypothetical protein [Nocardia abscessus]MBF6334499.1 hypothetical protein [Nocardia abscessus]MCC3327353.1 hypothetical protein [Nocardia abscessus]
MKSKFGRSLGAAIVSAGVVVSALVGTGVAEAATVTAKVRCDKVENKGGATVGWLEAEGTGNNVGEALANAEKNVQVPEGYYKRHCRPTK